MAGNKPWTKEEEELLAEMYGTCSLDSLAQYLGRSVNAIRVRRNKLGLGPLLDADEYITWNQLLNALGYTGGDGYKARSWIENRGCPVKYMTVEKCQFKIIYIDDFWKWAKKNSEFIDFTKMEPLILGKEPAWLKETRHLQWQKKFKFKTTPWTKSEDQKLKYMVEQYKYSMDEISRELGRTCGAVQRRLCDIGIKARPIKAETHNMWTDEEFAILADCINKRVPYEIISDMLPARSTKSIRGKVYCMYKTEDINKAACILNGGKWGDNRADRKIYDTTLNAAERAEVKDNITKFVMLLKGKICEHYENNDYWQRLICQFWNDGCEAGEDNCDECTSFIRIKPQYCKRCGRTFTERGLNDFCPECRNARKKAAQRKYMRITHRHSREARG